MTRQKSPWMQGPEGRPPNVSPARKGWEINPEDDPSAVGAALNRSFALPVSLGFIPSASDPEWSDLHFLNLLLTFCAVTLLVFLA